MSLTKLDRAIKIIKFILSEKQERIDSISKKINSSEQEKIFIGQEADLIRNVNILIEAVKKEFNAHLGKLPPQAIDIEETILGSLMLEKTAHCEEVFRVLKSDHFYNEPHRAIYAAITDLWKEKSAIDMRTVVIRLRKNGVLDLVGGSYYIAELTSKVASAANIQTHIHILIEFAIKRKLIQSCSKVLVDAYEDKGDCFDLLDVMESELKIVNEWIK